MNTGLIPLPKDHRDFNLGSIVKEFPKPESLPKEFVLDVSEVKNQLDDFCTANTVALLIGINEGIECDENWGFAKSKELSGNVDEWGQDLRTAFKVGEKFGGLPKKNSPFKSEKGGDFLRRPENWPQGIEFYALPQKQKTFWKIDGPYDPFDNIRSSMWYLKNIGQKQGVGIGLMWGFPSSQYVLEEIKDQGYGHAVACIGWEGEHLIIQNSWGPSAGKNGRHLIYKDVVNHFFNLYGAFVYLDLPRAQAELYIDTKTKLEDNWIIGLWKSLKKFVKDIFFFDRAFGMPRSPGWREVRRAYIQKNPLCELCGKTGKEVHHILPFYVAPEKELDVENFITVCRPCHFSWGHLYSWKSWNAEVRRDAIKIKNRP